MVGSLEHNYEMRQGFDGNTVLYCTKCGKSYRLITYTATPTKPSRAAWEEMTFETPNGEPIRVYSCTNGS